jgi:hypothetical protein
MGQSPPAAAAASSAAKTVITTTAIVPNKKIPMADAVPDTNRTAPIDEVTTPLVSEPAAGAPDDVRVAERAETGSVQDAAASNAEDKKVPAADAPPGADSGSAAAVELAEADEAAAAGDRGGMKEAAVEGKSDESQGEEAVGGDEPAPVEDNEEGDQVAADEEPSPGADDPAAEPTGEVVDEE